MLNYAWFEFIYSIFSLILNFLLLLCGSGRGSDIEFQLRNISIIDLSVIFSISQLLAWSCFVLTNSVQL